MGRKCVSTNHGVLQGAPGGLCVDTRLFCDQQQLPGLSAPTLSWVPAYRPVHAARASSLAWAHEGMVVRGCHGNSQNFGGMASLPLWTYWSSLTHSRLTSHGPGASHTLVSLALHASCPPMDAEAWPGPAFFFWVRWGKPVLKWEEASKAVGPSGL